MSLTECQINPIDVNFHLQKSFESFIKNSAEKIQYKKDKGIKVPPPLMPIRVKHKNCPKMSDFKICTCLTFDPAPSPYFPL